MQTVLIFAELVIAVALVIFVLLQRSEGGGLGIGGGGGGGGMGGLFSPRGAADTLTRTTAILATLFFMICIGLNLVARHAGPTKSILESPPATTAPAAPATPSVPKPQ